MCLGNNSKDFFVDNMKKTGFNGYVYDFSVDYNIIDISNIINIHKYLIKNKKWYKIVFGIINLHPNEYSQEFGLKKVL